MKFLILVLLSVSLAACAVVPVAPPPFYDGPAIGGPYGHFYDGPGRHGPRGHFVPVPVPPPPLFRHDFPDRGHR